MARNRAWRRYQTEKIHRRLNRYAVEAVRFWELEALHTGRILSRFQHLRYWLGYYRRGEGNGIKPYKPSWGCRCSWCIGTYKTREASDLKAAKQELREWELGDQDVC
jgi:hypothetical protein